MKPTLASLLYSTTQDDKVCYAGDTNLQPWTAWEKAGILVPGPLQDHLFCDGCHDFVKIVWITNKINGEVSCMHCCATCGPEEIDPLKLRTWTVRMEPLMEKLATALEMSGGVLSVIPNLLWKLGIKRGRTAFYLRRFWQEEKRGLLAELARFGNPLVICGKKITCENLVYDYSGQCVALEKVAHLDEQGNLILDKTFFAEFFAEFFESSPEPREEKNKPSVPAGVKRGRRTAKIEKLVKEMEQHLRDARAHALATAASGNIELLPRPTQEELAKRTGMLKMEVTRCLQDPQAKLLNLLWDRALDLKFIAK